MQVIDRAERHEDRIRARIRKARHARGWSQEKLAREAELSKETIRLIEAGLRTPTIKTLHMLAHAFGCSVDDLAKDDSRGIPERNGYEGLASLG